MTAKPDQAREVPPNTWIIIPVHNRREITLRCLSELQSNQGWELMDIVVVDDGSTDGTAAGVREQYPSVHLLEGDGSLWWGGAMKQGMEYADDRDAEVFIWLNDDVIPRPGAIDRLAAKTAELGDTVLGGVVHPQTGHEYTTRWNRSFFGMESVRYEPDLEIQPCDMLAGKLVAFPRTVVEQIGFPATDEFHHAFADFEYTSRATDHGFSVGVYSDAVAMDTAYEIGHSGLSEEFTFVETVKGVIDPSSDRSISMKYRRDKLFGTAPDPILFGYNFGKGIAVISLKFVLCVLFKRHRF